MNERVAVIGAGGATGQRIARELASRGVLLTLAGRRPDALEPLALELGAQVTRADLTSPAALVPDARLVVNTAGPFTRLAGDLIQACLVARIPYVDIANEHTAIEYLLGLHQRAAAHGAVLVTGAGFGPAVTEALVLGLMKGRSGPPAAVRVAAAPSAGAISPGVFATAAQAAEDGAARYSGGKLVYEPLGSGARQMLLDGHAWQVIPAPVGDLETARRASSAPDVTAYFAAPGQRPGPTGVSYAYADIQDVDGTMAGSLAVLGDAMATTAAIAAAIVCRVLADEPARVAGAWTPGTLYGQDLITDACDVTVTSADPRAIWAEQEQAAQ
jgi:short subunit dehydrogenase-like uncharacterized protein